MPANPRLANCIHCRQPECPAACRCPAEGANLRLILARLPAGMDTGAWLRGWAEGCSLVKPARAAWIDLAPGDDEPGAFWARTAAGIAAAAPELAERIAFEPDEGDPFDLSWAVEGLINLFAGELSGEGGCEFLLVFENYAMITAAEIHRCIQLLLDYLPDGLCLVISSPIEPPLQLARLRVRRQMIEIGL